MARRYMQAMNRKRRIRYLERSLPKSICSAWMLDGALRRLRKEHPNLELFKRCPRKLRLKNNRNVNLFWKADRTLARGSLHRSVRCLCAMNQGLTSCDLWSASLSSAMYCRSVLGKLGGTLCLDSAASPSRKDLYSSPIPPRANLQTAR